MTTFEMIRQQFPDYEPAFPSDWPRPTAAELTSIEADFDIHYSEQFRDFQLSACHTTPIGDFDFDNFGWAETSLGPMGNLRTIVRDAQDYGVPRELAPFRCDNSDYFCLTKDGAVVIWDHNSGRIAPEADCRWKSFADWLLHGLQK